jgi:uncharacterized MAPEG superfamily protein
MMLDWALPYRATVAAMGTMGGLLLLQMIVADVAGMRAGHVPGAAVSGGHDDFFFRAFRAHANTNETLGAFILLALFGILRTASPWGLNVCATVYVAARMAHMLCYYADIKLMRSASFVVAFLALVGMLVVGVAATLR